MPQIKLPDDTELIRIVKHPAEYPNRTVVMAMELLEYRMHYGPLGCEFLDTEGGAFAKMIDPDKS